MNKILIIFFIVIIVYYNNYSQSKTSFILPSYSVMDSLVLDFNNDSINDFIMAVESSLQDSLEEEYPRILIVLQGIDSINYKLKAINDTLLLCKNCGGFFDPFEGLSFRQDTLQIHQYGGSIWRWGIDYSCVYNRNNEEWYIVSEYTYSYNNLDRENTWKNEKIYFHQKMNK